VHTRTNSSHRPAIRAGALAAVRRLVTLLVTMAVLVGGFAVSALGAGGLVVTPASGGSSINDTTGGPSGSYTTLGNIVLDESASGQIGLGTLVVTTPSGFDWRTTAVTVAQSGASGSNSILLSANPSSCTTTATSVSVTPTTSSITVRVCRASGHSAKLTFSGLAVRPTTQTPLASGNIYLDSSSTSTVSDVTKGPSGTNLGSLAMVPTAATSLRVAGLPSPFTTNSSASVTVTALDAAGNTATGYRGTVGFASSDGAAVLPANYAFTAADAGVHAFAGGVTLKTVGTQSVTATDTVSSSITGSAALQVVPAAAATVTVSLAPDSLVADGTSTAAVTATVTDAYGNHRAGDTVSLASSGDAAISSVTDNGDGTYGATITASTTPGDETITATDGAAAGTATLHELTPLSVASVSPASRGQGANGGPWGQSITVTGAGFVAGSSADFGAGVTTKFTTFVDAEHLTAHVVVAGDATPGSRDVTVSNPGGRSASCAGCFTVNAGPSLASVSPSGIGAGGARKVTFTGANFDASTRVTFPGSGVAVTSVTLVDAEHLSVGISTAASATPGPRDVVVTNGDAGSATCAGCLTVTAAPTVTTLTPNALGPGALKTVTVDGSNFASGAKVSFAASGVAATAVTFVSDTRLTITVSVASNAAAGPRAVTVTNPDLGKGSCSACFSVSPGPAVTSVSPGTLARGSSQTVTVNGANFASNASLSLGAGISVTAVTVADASRITATVTVASTAAVGPRTVTVTNPDGGKVSATGYLSVS